MSTNVTGVPYGTRPSSPATFTKRDALQRLTPPDARWTWRDVVVAWMQELADVRWVEYLIW